MKAYFLLIAFCVSLQFAEAQTAVWQLHPTDYSEITIINNNLYKVFRNGKIGLIHSDGTIVTSVENDNLSDFYEGKAIVTVNDGHGERIDGCLTEDGTYYHFNKKYYTLNGQKFFSDGVISVANEQGKLGYIDVMGTEVCGFDGKYDKIKPFSEGYAAVFKNKKYYLINKEGTPIRFTFKSVGEVFGGTNVFNGLAYIWDTTGKFYTYNINNDAPCRSIKAPQNTKSLDYLYRFSCISGANKEVPFVEKKYSGVKGLLPSENGGLYGYNNDGNIILPFQFHSAGQFENGNAIVNQNGRLGIIRYVDGNSFSVSEISNKIVFYAGKTTTCQFNIEIPEVWRNADLKISIKDPQGISIETTHVNNSYSFTQKLSSSCRQEYKVTISGDGLRLFDGHLSYSFIKKEVCATCGKDKDKCTGHNVEPKKTTEKTCPTCKKKISECKYQGVH